MCTIYFNSTKNCWIAIKKQSDGKAKTFIGKSQKDLIQKINK